MNKKKNITLSCPFCGKTESIHYKVKGFKKAYLISFNCGFKLLYNKKSNKLFIDDEWNCNSTCIDPSKYNSTMTSLRNNKKSSEEFRKDVKRFISIK